MTPKEELEQKRDQLRVFSQHGENGTWDNDSKEVIHSARKLVFAWLIAEPQEYACVLDVDRGEY